MVQMRDRETGVVRDVGERWLKRWPNDYIPVEEAQSGDLDGFKVAELRGMADELGLEYPPRAKKEDLVKLLSERQADETTEPQGSEQAATAETNETGGETEGEASWRGK
jgi:hypothetical protein